MASALDRRRNNIRAGVFVSICLVLGFAVILALTRAWDVFQRTDEYIVSFPVDAGVGFLAEGAEVRVGGVRMGKVSRIEPRVERDPFDTVHVHIAIDSRITLHDNARIIINSALIGKEAWLDIVSVGDRATGQRLATGSVIAAEPPAGFLSTLLGPQQATRTAQIIEHTAQLSEFIARFEDEYNMRVAPILDDLGETSSHAASLMRRVRDDDYPQWADRLNAILATAGEAMDRLDEAFAEGRLLVDDGRHAVVDVRRTVGRAESILADHRGNVDEIVDNVRETTGYARELGKTVNTETIDRAHDFLRRAGEGVDSFADIAARLTVELEAELPGLAEALANARLASQQIKLATIEIRRSPWKLLYRPSATELEHELLYEATRSFALAVSDLKAASMSVDRVLTRHAAFLKDDPEVQERLRKQLLGSFAAYERAQQRLIDVLLGTGGG